MQVVKLSDTLGTDREVKSNGWTSRRLLLADTGMGFSLHDTIIHAGAELEMHYKNHLEAVYCIKGNGELHDIATGEVHKITPGVVYALNNHDKHVLKAETEMQMVCVFNPPVTGREVHASDGSYPLTESIEKSKLRRM